MKRWTWLAIAAATGACSFPTGEFNLGAPTADVPAADRGVDAGPADVPAVIDLGAPDVPVTMDVVAVDAPPPDVVAADAADVQDAGPADDAADGAADAAADAGPTDDAADAGPADDAPCPAGRVLCAGACVDLLNDLDHCGRCGFTCNATNGAAVCAGGRCEVTCRAGFADCDTDPRNGCEVGLGTITNCRSCGDACPAGPALNGAPACTASMCRTTCSPGYGNCDGNVANGCEVSLATSNNCGVCGRVCPAGQLCTGGACIVTRSSNYARTPLATTFVDVCAIPGSARLLPSQDDGGVLVPMPFAFSYWGNAVAAGAMVNVSTNGFISLDGVINSSLYGLVPDPARPNGVIAAWWTDLFTSPTGICTAVTGVAPSRRFLVQWSSVAYFANRATDMSFEIAINEVGNSIDLIYQRLAPLPPGYVPTVGLESTSGTQGLSICSTANPTCNVFAGNAFRFNPI